MNKVYNCLKNKSLNKKHAWFKKKKIKNKAKQVNKIRLKFV